MGVSFKQWGIDEFAAKLIKRKARQLIGKAGLNRSDREDIEQDLIVAVLTELRRYDPSKGKKEVFVSKIVDDKASKILRYHLAEMRYHGREEFSLNEMVHDEGRKTERAAMQPDCTHRYESPDAVLARLDLEAAVSGLSAELRALYGALKQFPLAEAARQLGIPQSTAWDRLQELRASLRAAGVCEESDFPPESETSAGDDSQ